MVYHYRPRRKRKINKRVIILIISLFVLAGLIYLLFCSPIFNIKSIKITGNQKLKVEDIEENLNGQNLFLTSVGAIKTRLTERLPEILSLSAKKNIIKRELEISLIEREAIAIVCKAEKCFYLDKEGIIFENAPQTSGSLVVLINDFSSRDIKLGDKIFNADFFSGISEIKDEMANLGLKVLSFDSMNFPVQDVKAMTSEGWYAFFNLNHSIQRQILALKAALKAKIQLRAGLEYIDLRIENRVYYK
jgi:hypothetical protein